MNGISIPMIINLLIAAAVFICVIADILHTRPITRRNFCMFRYFTVLSNVFMGTTALICGVYTGDMPLWLKVVRLSATGCVVVTMLTTVLFLGPTSKNGFFSLFKGSSLFMHLLVPVAATAVLLIYGRTDDITVAHALIAALPVLIYGLGYLFNALAYAEGGKVPREHDWYGFVSGGLKYAWISMPVMLAAGAAIMLALRYLSRA